MLEMWAVRWRSELGWTRQCLESEVDDEYAFPQWQIYGFSPECVRLCEVKVLDCEKACTGSGWRHTAQSYEQTHRALLASWLALRQISQTKRFSPVWMRL